MSIRREKIKTVFGVILGNRDVFPDQLVMEGRKEILEVLNELKYDYVILDENKTQFGAVETYKDAIKCANLFREHTDEILGVLIVLSNFGNERGIANSIKMANLNVPILIQASSDDINQMDRKFRRDAFCGKISVCNNLYQYAIPFTLTKSHTCPINSKEFKNDIIKFEAICRIVHKVKNARLGQIGTRPAAFNTVRYSEKILEKNGISIEPIDLSEILAAINKLNNDDINVKETMEYLKNYTETKVFPEEGILKLAKLTVIIKKWVMENDLDGFAFQCWPSIQDNFGIVPCAVLSMFSEGLIPGACEVDISGLIGMLILQLASGSPSAILDWNNNYKYEEDKMVTFHCSNLPRSFLKEAKITTHPIISDGKGAEKSFGAIQGRIPAESCTFLRIETDDINGKIKGILGEGKYTDDPLQTFGGYGVLQIPNLQRLLKKLCKNGFAHHVAATLNKVGDIVYEALTTYLGWDIDYHT